MEVRDYDVEIDGVCLGRYLFDDARSQQGLKMWLQFNRWVRRCGPHDSREWLAFYAHGVHPFAELPGTALCFALHGDFVYVKAHQPLVRLSNDLSTEYLRDSWWPLQFDARYRVLHEGGQMQLCVRQRRPALAEVMRWVLDRANRGRSAARQRVNEGGGGTENEEPGTGMMEGGP
jgi:hypothetical protein